jgi:RNA polymerase sigma-70 factor (ECF subfamily)
MPPDLSDDQLMQRYGDGDLSAFQQLYARHRVGLYRFVAWRSPRAEWVDEVGQDTWANLIDARARYRPQSSATFRTFLYQIARNRLLDLLRQQQPVLAAELGNHMGSATDGASLFDALADAVHDSRTPEQLLEQREQHDSLHRAVASLPGEQREALVLQQFSGLSIEEIAQLVAVPGETVKSRLRYAMRKLRAQLTTDEVHP